MYLNTLNLAVAWFSKDSWLVHSCFSDQKKRSIAALSQHEPLVIRAVSANRSDQLEILPTVVSFPAVPGKPGRPRTHPDKLYADASDDCEATRSLLRWLGIEPHIRRRNGDHGSHLGRVRWVVARTISWIKGLRRMRVRYDRSATSIDAWTSIAAAVVCLQILTEATA